MATVSPGLVTAFKHMTNASMQPAVTTTSSSENFPPQLKNKFCQLLAQFWISLHMFIINAMIFRTSHGMHHGFIQFGCGKQFDTEVLPLEKFSRSSGRHRLENS